MVSFLISIVISLYQLELDRQLQNLPPLDVTMCTNLSCDNVDHKHEIDYLCSALTDLCLDSDKVFPRNSMKSRHKCIPGWNDEIKPFRQEYLWWYRTWKDLGKPREGVAFEYMKTSKRQYMYSIRRCKRRDRENRFLKMAQCLTENRSRDFYKEVKKMKQLGHVSHSMNGETDSAKIANIFGDKYKALFNSVPPDADSIAQIEVHIQETMLKCKQDSAVITTDAIVHAVRKLKSGKGDGHKGLMSNHLIFASNLLYEMMSKLVTAIMTHGVYPNDLLLSTIFSIPKDCKSNLCVDTNYRGIRLMSSIGKVIYLVLLGRNKHKLHTSDLQFAYKEKHSTTMCSMVLKEVIQCYFNSGSCVASCFLDSSKAFDRVRHDRLFQLLMQRQLSPLGLRILYNQYKFQKMRAEWNGEHSSLFSAVNGIRQGGIISPVLYCVYQDELINRLAAARTGCWIGSFYFGCLSYADDLTLMCPTASGLQDMVNTCESYGSEYGVSYNATKSKCVMFSRGGKEPDSKVCLQGVELTWTNTMKYLGTYLRKDLSESEEIAKKRGDMVGRVNTLLSYYGKAPDAVLCKLFNTQCCHLYGAQAWNLQDRCISDYVTMWNRCVRRTLSLPYRTHTRFLPTFIGRPHVIEQIYGRFVSMVRTMQAYGNQTVQFLVTHALGSPGSITRGNLEVISQRTDVKVCDMLHKKTLRMFNVLNDTEISVINAINELRNHYIDSLDNSEKKDLIEFLCCK